MSPNNKQDKHRQSHSKGDRRQPSRRSGMKRHFGCGICQADHRLPTCKKFLKLNLAEKYKTAVKLHYCINCLARNHLIEKCSSKARCQQCSGKHHSVLHGPARILKDLDIPSASTSIKNPPIPAPRRFLATTSTQPAKPSRLPTSLHKVLVPTAEVCVMTEDGCKSHRAILNPSSTSSRIANTVVERSKLITFSIDGRKYVKLTVTPNMSSIIKYEMYFLVCRDLPKTPYPAPIKEEIKEKFGNLALADPNFHSNAVVEMELGGDLYSQVLKSNIIRVDGGSLLAQDSSLGWLIMGSYSG